MRMENKSPGSRNIWSWDPKSPKSKLQNPEKTLKQRLTGTGFVGQDPKLIKLLTTDEKYSVETILDVIEWFWNTQNLVQILVFLTYKPGTGHQHVDKICCTQEVLYFGSLGCSKFVNFQNLGPEPNFVFFSVQSI